MYPQFQGVGAITVHAQFIIFLQTLHGAYCWMGPRTDSYQHAHHCMTRATLSFSDDDDAVYCMHMRIPTCNRGFSDRPYCDAVPLEDCHPPVSPSFVFCEAEHSFF